MVVSDPAGHGMISRVTTDLQTETPGLVIQACTAQHQGDRPTQQDRVAILRGRRAPRCVLAVLADGVGGRSGGELAASEVVATAQRRFAEFSPGDPVERFFEDLVHEIHIVLQLAAVTVKLEPHATLATLLLQPHRIDWCHVGDSRVYHVRDRRVAARTVDDTFLERMLSGGAVMPARARLHPSAARLTQALGGARVPFPHLGGEPGPRAGDAFLLCTDGAWAHLSDDDIAAGLSLASPREAAARFLAQALDRADDRGDNCSMVVVKLGTTPA
jgi:serine/threonine protein phosphatase PrpC